MTMTDDKFWRNLSISAVLGAAAVVGVNVGVMQMTASEHVKNVSILKGDFSQCASVWSRCPIVTDKGTFLLNMNTNIFGEGRPSVADALRKAHDAQSPVSLEVRGYNSLLARKSILSVDL